MPGTLNISDGGIIELELLQAFGDEVSISNERVARIVGQIERENFVTLDGCANKKPGANGGIFKTRYNVERAFTGVTLKAGENPYFKSLSFSAEGLNYWVGLNEITIDRLPRGEGTITLSYKQPGHLALNLENGMKLFIMSTFTYPGRFSINEDYTLRQKVDEFNIRPITSFTLFSPDGRELDEYIPVVKEITAFLCFAANRLVYIDSMSAETANSHSDFAEETTNMDQHRIYYESWPYPNNKSTGSRPNSFEFSALEDHGETLIKKWMVIYDQIGPALDLYLLALMGAHPTSQGRFLALAQALEACHRRINGGRKSFGERIEDITEPHTELIGGEETRKDLVRWIANTRTYFTHYNPDREAEAAKGEDLRHLCFKMECFFQLYILQLLDFNNPHPDLKRLLPFVLRYHPKTESQEPKL